MGKTFSTVLAFLLWFLVSPLGWSAELEYKAREPFRGGEGPEAIYLTGEIVPGDYERLLRFIASDTQRFWDSTGIVLSSPGGDVAEALKIAKFVKGTFTPVWVGEWAGSCVSACFFIYASAAEREAGSGTVGVHRPYLHPRRLENMTVGEAEQLQKELMRVARSYLLEEDVPTSIIDAMFQRASTEVYWLTRDDLDKRMGRMPHWYQQYLVSRCGYDPDLERQYFETANAQLREEWFKAKTCGHQLSWPEAREFLRTELLGVG